MTTLQTGADGADERTRIATLLSRYPELPDHELDHVHAWFRQGATALDLGLLASDQAVAQQYRAYRADHYDRITPTDYIRILAVLMTVIGVATAIALMAA
jgi:hypothetical protein